MKRRDKRLKGLLCVEGLETACLRKVPFNKDLINKKNQTGQIGGTSCQGKGTACTKAVE